MAKVYYNHDRWVVDCDDEWCGGAEQVQLADELTACSNCRRFIEIVWPPNPGELLAVLVRRPVPQTRNWYPGETVSDLEAENEQYGVVA